MDYAWVNSSELGNDWRAEAHIPEPTVTTAAEIRPGQDYRTPDGFWNRVSDVKVLSSRVTIEHADGTFRVLAPTARVQVR